MSEMRFDGKVALVTGAASGIGRNHALELARRGAAVVINDIARDENGASKAELFAADLQAQGFTTAFNSSSVDDETSVEAMIEETVSRFGRIDLLVNNAGRGSPVTVQDLTTQGLREVLELHVFGSFW